MSMTTARLHFIAATAGALSLLSACSRSEPDAKATSRPPTPDDQQHTAGSGGIPKAVFPQTEFDLGTVTKAQVEHAFTFRNEGTGPLVMDITGCGQKFSKRVVPPGETATFTMSFAAIGKHDDAEEAATIKSNDPQHKEIVMKLRGRVALPAQFEPFDVDFGEIGRGESVTRRVKVVGPKAGLVEPTILAAPKEVAVTVRKLSGGPSPEFEFQFTVSPTAPLKALDGFVTLAGGDDSLRLGIRATVLASVVARPQILHSQVGTAGALTLPDLSLTSRKGRDLQVVSIKDSLQLLHTSVVPQGAGKLSIHSTVSKVPAGRYVGGTLTIRTNDPETPSVLVRYILDRNPAAPRPPTTTL
jgi:hypothetical protein